MSKLYYAVRHINLKMLHKAIKKACLRTLGILKHAEGRARLRYLNSEVQLQSKLQNAWIIR